MAAPHQRHDRFYWHVLLRPRHFHVRLVAGPPLRPQHRLPHAVGVDDLKNEYRRAALLFHADRSKLSGQNAGLTRRSSPR